MAQLLFFLYFAGMGLFSSVLTIGLRNPVYCTIALLSTFIHVAGLFVLLNAEFLAAIQIIIYAGAVLILYLFVLMLLNLKSTEPVVHRQLWIALFFGVVILAEILVALFKTPMLEGTTAANAVPPAMGNTEAIGLSLFNEYLLPFELVGIILLGGIIGALVLAKQPRPESSKTGGNGTHALEVPLPPSGNGQIGADVREESRSALHKVGSA